MSAGGKEEKVAKPLAVVDDDYSHLGLAPYLDKIREKYQVQADLENKPKKRLQKSIIEK